MHFNIKQKDVDSDAPDYLSFKAVDKETEPNMCIIKSKRTDTKKSLLSKPLATYDESLLSNQVDKVIILQPQQYVKPTIEEEDLAQAAKIDKPYEQFLLGQKKTYKIDDQGDGEDPSFETAREKKERAMQNRRILTIT